MQIEILVGALLGLGLYFFLAKSEDLEWNHRTKRFEDWRKKPEYKNLKFDKVTGKIIN